MPWTQLAPPAQAALDNAAVYQALGVAGPDGRQHFQVGFVQQLGSGFQGRHLLGRLDPAHPVHQFGAVHDAGVGQQGGYLLPAVGADIALLEADGLLRQSQPPEHIGSPLVWRLGIVVYYLDAFQPGIAAGQGRRV